ncbi:MAG: lipocalin family protein [Alistipes sp.]|nr:lipocalin family protein [Alistipes sp.]
MKKLTLLFCTLALSALMFGGCGNDDDKVGDQSNLYGSRYLVKYSGWEYDTSNSFSFSFSTSSEYQMYMTFDSDGTGVLREVDREDDWDYSEAFKWYLDEEVLFIIDSDGDVITQDVAKLTSSSLVLEISEYDHYDRMEYKKQK